MNTKPFDETSKRTLSFNGLHKFLLSNMERNNNKRPTKTEKKRRKHFRFPSVAAERRQRDETGGPKSITKLKSKKRESGKEGTLKIGSGVRRKKKRSSPH